MERTRDWPATFVRWGAPLAVAVVLTFQADSIAMATGAIVAAGVIVLAARRPGRSLVVLTALLPFGSLLLALLYTWGVPAPFVRGMGSWKEALAIGVVVAAVRGFRERGERIDRLDRVLLAFVGTVTVYLVFASVLAGRGAVVLPFHDRLLGWRANAAFVLLLFGARHAPMTPADRRAWGRAAVATGCAVAAIGLYQYLQPDAWSRFVLETVQYPRYVTQVLGKDGALQELLDWINIRPVRASSTLFSAFALGDYLLIALAIGVARLVRGRTSPWFPLVPIVAAVGIAATLTRASLFGAALVGVLALVAPRGRHVRPRVRFGLALLVILALAVPPLTATRIGGRNGGAQSSAEHVNETRRGVEGLVHRPLGTGLATGAGLGRALGVDGVLVSDNSIVGVGNELGIVTMALMIWLLLALVTALRRASAEEPDDPLARAMVLALLGLTLSGMFHHVWIDVPTAWTLWAGAGLSLGVAERSRRSPTAPPAPARTRPASRRQPVPT